MHTTAQRQLNGSEDDLDGFISAGMDGELDDKALNQLIQRYKQDAHCQSQWETYHMIGDILRQTPFTTSNLVARVNHLLTDEPTVLAPQHKRSVTKYAMPMAASLAAVMLVAWSALNLPTASSVPAPALAAAQMQQDKIDQVQLADFIAAHRDYSPGASSPFVNAAYQVTTERSR
ncbi:sigma-E factor negative regulatory protein [Sulfuriferula sp. AH1]|uniref:sigma-E factor negative regulatory protein n=1 Tax=Sulfuriferula sp. AH1 TaxID=1985873 RepID=UPI0012F7E070|nr:RseA family anti-sigma factor [Sulfuriferula sp. AH1]